MAGEFEKLAFESALRGLDKQEGYLEELRARTGVVLAASSLAASFLGQQAFQSPSPPGLVALALLAFVVSTAANVFILVPKRDLIFSQAGVGLYEGLFAVVTAFTLSATALVIEILALAGLLGDTIL